MKMLEASTVSNSNVFDALRKQSEKIVANGDDRSTDKTYTADKYSGLAANEALFARALTSALAEYIPETNNKIPSFENVSYFPASLAGTNVGLTQNDPDFVQSNVLASIENTIRTLTAKGASPEELNFLKEQAVEGIQRGFSKAEKELTEVTGNALIDKIQQTKESLLNSVVSLEVPQPNQKVLDVKQSETLELHLKNDRPINVTFSLANLENDNSDFAFTTLNNNVSISISGDLNGIEQDDVIRAFDGASNLVHTFFRTDVEKVLDTIERNGLSRSSFIDNSDKLTNIDFGNAALKYSEVAELSSESVIGARELGEVRAYSKQLNESISLADSLFASQNHYKEIINGIINQVKDVQVPDLLSAINKIHSFNSRLI